MEENDETKRQSGTDHGFFSWNWERPRQGYAKEGADIIINGRNLEKAKPVAKEIEGLGVRTMAIGADVSVSQDVTRMVEEAVKAFGKVDILVNNAGVNPFILEAEKIKEEGWDQVLDIDLKGVFLCCQAVGKKMIQQGGGRIIREGSPLRQSLIINRSSSGRRFDS